MSPSSPARWLAALPVFTALSATAQLSATPAAPATSVAAAASSGATPSLSFHSAFDGYRPFAEEAAVPWKEANDAVRRRGGWRAYAKEAQREAGEPSAGGADPHAGHSMPMPGKKEQP